MMKELSAILGSKVAIIGLGKSGKAAKALIEIAFPKVQLIVFDDTSPEGTTTNPDDVVQFGPDCLIVSPGYPLQKSWLQNLIKSGVQFLNEVDLASFFLENEKAIGVTGSIGKSTTSALIYEGSLAEDPNAFLGANFGTPLCDYVIQVLQKKRARAKWLTLELSSYHLETLRYLNLEISLITYLAPNHLERYSDLETYYNTKWKIAERTRGKVLLNLHSADLAAAHQKKKLSKAKGVHLNSGKQHENSLNHAQMIGEHNKQNILMALSVAEELGWSEQARERIVAFKGLSHRLENLGTHKGVLFINDSKATSIDSVLQAVESIRGHANNGKLYLLIGGKDKNLPWENLTALEKTNAEYIFFGQCGKKAQDLSHLSGPYFPTLREALSSLPKILHQGDVCLLSPGGTSLDEFKNFEERGNYFREFVVQNF